jgi:uncharacterized protein (DUF1684 family)
MSGRAPADPLALADWRRTMAEIYAHLRAAEAPEAGWHRWRQERDLLFRHHPSSPLPESARRPDLGLRYFDYDPAYRFIVSAEPVEGPVEAINLGADGSFAVAPIARTRGLAATLRGELTLYWIMGYGGGLFLPFADATSGRTTYGGGRYLLDTIKGADLGALRGRLILDFNFAYNPSCAYDPRWACPLAPTENRIIVSVSAGELTPI